jgi:L-alanine-DL-glutamate epimerase-like enolase superfamily enzyme
MRVESVDLIYVAMPDVLPIGDGSQDALLVRVRAGGCEGWGQCEASPLACIAAYVTPLSHSACRPVGDAVLGAPIDGPADIAAITRRVRTESFDLLQAPHMLSGVDIALWDLLGRREGAPVWALLGAKRAYPKVAYASALFGSSPEQTEAIARRIRSQGFRAAKFGWGPYGTSAPVDRALVMAARDGLGPEVRLLIDAGTIFVTDVEAARARLDALIEARVEFFEEPFTTHALSAYRRLAAMAAVPLAAGEGSHDPEMAANLIEHDVRVIQIDAGRVGGITAAAEVATRARERSIRFVNHTFTTRLSLSASLQAMAGIEQFDLCEYPLEPSEMATAITDDVFGVNAAGLIEFPDAPGLGVSMNAAAVERYRVPVEITVGGRRLTGGSP